MPDVVVPEMKVGQGVDVMPKAGGGYSLAGALPLGGRRRSKKAGRRSRRGGADEMVEGARRRKTAGRRSRRGGVEQVAARRRRH